MPRLLTVICLLSVGSSTAWANGTVKDVCCLTPSGDEIIEAMHREIITNCNTALRLNPNDAKAYLKRGHSWNAKGNYEKAIADYNSVMRINPKCTEAYIRRGNIWIHKKAYHQAISDFSNVIRLDPKNVTAYNIRGNVWRIKKKYDKALADYNTAIRLAPKNEYALTSRGIIWQIKKEYGKALADYNTAIRFAPKEPRAYFNKAFILAAHPDAKHRDGKKAVLLARKARQLIHDNGYHGRNSPGIFEGIHNGCSLYSDEVIDGCSFIDVMAAAYAEAGYFKHAVQLQKNGLDQMSFYAKKNGADHSEKIKPLQARLKLYQAKKPFRLEAK